MAAKSIRGILVIGILLFPLCSINTVIAEDSWWNTEWSYRQELVIDINTSSELAAFQPVDTTIFFTNPCWARDAINHSIRLISQDDIELESQIYDLKYIDDTHIASCNIVFLTPQNMDENTFFYVYYNESATLSPGYPDYVSIEDSSYYYEPISGYPLQSQYYKISQQESIIYAVAQQGQFLWYSTSQYITKLKKGSTEMMPKNAETVASFDFTYYYENEMWQYNSTSQQLLSKRILCDGNLMVSCEIVSRSIGDDLQTNAVYTYYYCPMQYKRIHVHVTHQALTECIIYPQSNTDGTFGSLQCGGIQSNSIQDLNFGTLYPYLHVFTEQNIVQEYQLETNPEYIPEDPVIRLIKTSDDVDVGKNAWASFDEGTTGSVHALLFSSSSVIKAGIDERDGIQLKAYESDYPHLPGLEYNTAAFQFTRNAFEAGNATKDLVIPKGFIASFYAEFFSSPTGGYPLVEIESKIFQTLVKLKPISEINGSSKNHQIQNRYSLTVYLHSASSIPFGSALSIISGRNFSYITVELYAEETLVSSGSATRLPLNALNSSEQSSFVQRLIATIHIFDFRNFSLFKKIEFQDLTTGRYLVKVFKDNSVIGNHRQYIGYASLELTNDSKTHVFCTQQGFCWVSVVDQEGNGIDDASVQLLHDGVIIAKNTTKNGRVVLTAPCGLLQQYRLIILYHGFIVINESIDLGYVHLLFPLKKSYELLNYDWTLTLIDLWELPLEINVTPQLSSKEMDTPIVLSVKPQNNNYYPFQHLISATYQLQIRYKSFLVEKEIQIPSNNLTLIFPAVYLITFYIYDSHGIKITGEVISLSRGGKTIDLKSNVSGALYTIPPGSYLVSIFSQDQIISKQLLKVDSERSVNLFTTKEPIFPLIIFVIAGSIALIGLIISIIKKNPIYFLLLLALSLCLSSIVSPWWILQGSNIEVQTSSVLYLAPLNLVTLIKTPQSIGGELAFFPNLFIDVMTLVLVLIGISCCFICLSLIFNRIKKKKWFLILLIGTFCILICSLSLFSLTMFVFTKIGVGSFFGQGEINVSVTTEDMTTAVFCTWGPGIGIWIIVSSITIIISLFAYQIMYRKIRNFFYN